MYLLIYKGFCNRGFVLLFVSPGYYSRGKCWLEVGLSGMMRVRYLVVRVVCGEGPVIWVRGLGNRVWLCHHRMVCWSYCESR